MSRDEDEIEFISAFGIHVKKLRESRNFTQAELAADLDCEISQISRIERGTINTSILMAYRISKVLEVDVSLLFLPLQ